MCVLPACHPSHHSLVIITKQTQGSELSLDLFSSPAQLHCGPPLLLLHFHPHARPAAGAQLPSQAKPSRRPRPSLLRAGAGRPNLDRKEGRGRPLPLFARLGSRPRFAPPRHYSLDPAQATRDSAAAPWIRPPNSAAAAAASPTRPPTAHFAQVQTTCLEWLDLTFFFPPRGHRPSFGCSLRSPIQPCRQAPYSLP